VQYVGAGLADLDAAVGAQVALSRPSISYGVVPSGSGKSSTQTVDVTNMTGGTLVLPVGVEDSTGAEDVRGQSPEPDARPVRDGDGHRDLLGLQGQRSGGTQAFPRAWEPGRDDCSRTVVRAPQVS
jgi:hypothetical protein